MNMSPSLEDVKLIGEIAKRAKAIGQNAGEIWPLYQWEMAITATHLNGTPLKLRELLHADHKDFAHDVFGIMYYLNRRTGRLSNSFVPRFYRCERRTIKVESNGVVA